MSDLRKAAEQALKYLENNSPETDTLVEVEPHVWEYRGSLVIQALRQALAQPEQEPVAWITNGGKGELGWRKTTEKDISLYTAPPKREWVGLSDEEKYDVLEGATGDGGRVYYDTLFRSYESKLKEKNAGA